MKKLFKNVTFENKIVNILVNDDLIEKIGSENYLADQVIECNKALVLLPFNDSHVHIDSALSTKKGFYNQSGSLFEGIEIWRRYKKNLTEADFIKRTNDLFNKYVANGVQNIRTHLDITGNSLEIIKWAKKQQEIWKDKLNIQIVGFPQDGLLSSKNAKVKMEKAIALGIDVIGGIPHYEFSAQMGYQSIDYILNLAKKHNLLVDLHCDEIDDGNSRFLEYLAARTWELDLQKKVTASHTTALAHYNLAYVRKIFNVLSQSKINIIANPLVNIHLGGRFENNNPGRGITKVKELLANKINVAYGSDSIQDPWYPLGDGNLIQVLFMGIHLNHLTGQKQILEAINLITINSAKIMQLKNYQIVPGQKANFIVMHQNNLFDVIRLIDKVQFNVYQGKIINL